MKKLLVLGTISLFIGLAFTSAAGVQVVKAERVGKAEVNDETETIEITTREYNGDGTFRETKRKMPMSEAKKLWEKLRDAEDAERKLTILKEYNLVSKDTNLEDYKKRVLEKMDDLALIRNSRKTHVESDKTVLNVLCKVEVCMLGLYLPVGSSFSTGFLNGWLCLKGYSTFIPSVDLLGVGIGHGYISTDGVLGVQRGENVSFSCVLFGFAGVFISYPFHKWLPAWEFYGFSPLVTGFIFSTSIPSIKHLYYTMFYPQMMSSLSS